MAESTLTTTRDDLRNAISFELGYGRTALDDSSDVANEIDDVLKSGLRQAYFPPPLPGRSVGHVWRFLRPTTTLVAWPTLVGEKSAEVYDAGDDETTITATGFQATMVGKQMVFTDSEASYLITAVSSSTEAVVSGDASAEADDFTVTANGNYDLPDDFAAIDGPLTFGSQEWFTPLPIMGEAMMRERRQFDALTGIPYMAAVAIKSGAATAGQRYQLMLYPTPDSVYNLSFRYVVLPDSLTAGASYHLGGAQHSELILASCMAAAEIHRSQVRGARWEAFIQRLAASVSMDNLLAPETLGSGRTFCEERHLQTWNIPVTINGTTLE
jgi:hypothetical protein